jgi:tetratricopeptide (TPR) repeat protein
MNEIETANPSGGPQMLPTHVNNSKISTAIGVVLIVLIAAGGYFLLNRASIQEKQYLRKGVEAFRAGQWIVANENFTSALNINNSNPVTYAYLGLIANPDDPRNKDRYVKGSYANAATNFEKALSLGLPETSVRYPEIYSNLGIMYAKMQLNDQADEQLLKTIDKFSGDISFWPRYFIALDYFNRANKPKEAFDLLSPAATMTAADSDLYVINVLLARLAFYFDDYAKTKEFANQAIGLHVPEEGTAPHVLLSYVAAHDKDPLLLKKEVAAARTLVKNDLVKNDGVECFISAAYVRLEDYDTAIATAMEVNPLKNTYPHSACALTLAQSYLAKGDKVDAVKYFKKYIEITDTLNPQNIFVVRYREQSTQALQELK